MLIRIENWVPSDEPNTLRRIIAPAFYITDSTLKPIELPSWEGRRQIVIVTALYDSAFVEIGHDGMAAFDPESRGRFLREGQEQRFFVWGKGFAMIQAGEVHGL